MQWAYRLGQEALGNHPKHFGRKGFTLPQLFACLVVREMLRLSYRKAEQLLRDTPAWLAQIGLSKAPDHNTLWRGFTLLCTTRRLNRMLDLLAQLFQGRHLLKLRQKPLAVDSTCYQQRHRSRHYERRCRKMQLPPGGKFTGKSRPSANAARSLENRRMPKLALACASACHLILGARVHIGSGSDAPDFAPLLQRACQRAPVRVVVADSGYDSESNHRTARYDYGVRSIIPPKAGRPSSKHPAGYWRRHMRRRFHRQADRPRYRHRAQAETVNSMLKRNLGDELRSRLPQRRKHEMLLRSVVHNIMLAASLDDI
jgi:hypothetical protein